MPCVALVAAASWWQVVGAHRCARSTRSVWLGCSFLKVVKLFCVQFPYYSLYPLLSILPSLSSSPPLLLSSSPSLLFFLIIACH
ncbi:hypothetical protein B0T24DRAFT_625112 [Lasiosphaeria ovina]|uniref:Secreted protein n=1 Tax=Lasiosphaeria ovina TaxID=92902 RepID=A0AAE0N8A9_9PEZI|nr:hypothetical protein B0T24DRAFT_625112 [Lasiosphaeria ovina]